jgi:DNA-directed RNA polymerase subunit RPC12/RpoP
MKVVCVRCKHEWDAKAWQERTGNVQCPECKAWNQVKTP